MTLRLDERLSQVMKIRRIKLIVEIIDPKIDEIMAPRSAGTIVVQQLSKNRP